MVTDRFPRVDSKMCPMAHAILPEPLVEYRYLVSKEHTEALVRWAPEGLEGAGIEICAAGGFEFPVSTSTHRPISVA